MLNQYKYMFSSFEYRHNLIDPVLQIGQLYSIEKRVKLSVHQRPIRRLEEPPTASLITYSCRKRFFQLNTPQNMPLNAL